MGARTSWSRVRVEHGIYLLPNGKYAVCCRRAGRLSYRTVGTDLALARSERRALVAAAEVGVAPVSPRLRFDTVAGWWLERFNAKVVAGERHPRTLEAHRYHLDRHLLPEGSAGGGSRRSRSTTSPSCCIDCVARAAPRRPRRARSRRWIASCASPATAARSSPTRSSGSSTTSARDPSVVASACLAAPRSSACSQSARAATG